MTRMARLRAVGQRYPGDVPRAAQENQQHDDYASDDGRGQRAAQR